MTLTCDLYNEFRRGKNQKVISYSLFDKNTFYYEKLKNITRQARVFYPGWLMRVYYDNTIFKSTICDVECSRDEYDNLIDNSDFCNSNQLYLNFGDYLNNRIFNADYMHSTKWRWLPIADSLVDVFSSRDSDSFILDREIDSVNVWLNSTKPGHIMRGILIYF